MVAKHLVDFPQSEQVVKKPDLALGFEESLIGSWNRAGGKFNAHFCDIARVNLCARRVIPSGPEKSVAGKTTTCQPLARRRRKLGNSGKLMAA